MIPDRGEGGLVALINLAQDPKFADLLKQMGEEREKSNTATREAHAAIAELNKLKELTDERERKLVDRERQLQAEQATLTAKKSKFERDRGESFEEMRRFDSSLQTRKAALDERERAVAAKEQRAEETAARAQALLAQAQAEKTAVDERMRKLQAAMA
jgi:chromosome segregation ATPase